MMTRHDIIFFVECTDYDSIAQIYPVSEGKYVKYDDAMEQIDFLKEALKNLKSTNIKLNTPEQLNLYVSSVLEECE